MEPRAHLRLVPTAGPPAPSERSGDIDVGFLAFVLVLNLVPIGATLAGGHWGDGSVGFATVVSMLCVHELVHELRARAAALRRSGARPAR